MGEGYKKKRAETRCQWDGGGGIFKGKNKIQGWGGVLGGLMETKVRTK